MQKIEQKSKSSWLEVVKTFVWAIVIAFIFRTLVFQPFHIPSGSMKPTLEIGDYLIVSKFSYGYSKHSANPLTLNFIKHRWLYSEPKRGDVVVFRIPEMDFSKEIWIKRIIGLPGDKIQVTGGVLYINGKAMDMKRDGTYTDPNLGVLLERYVETLPEGVKHEVLNNPNKGQFDIIDADNTKVYVVPEGHYFLMGDNRDDSQDSRFEPVPGFVPVENIIGRAEIILFASDGFFLNPLNWKTDRFFTWL